MIISVGAYKNLLFILVAIANTLISIINGIRAKRIIDKMRLIAEQKPTVIRDGKSRQIPQSQIVDGDLIVYGLGDQIIVDSRIEQGIIEVNESFITGEQDNVVKDPFKRFYRAWPLRTARHNIPTAHSNAGCWDKERLQP